MRKFRTRSIFSFGLLVGVVLSAFCLLPAVAERYEFENGDDGWTAQDWGSPKDKCTNVARSSFWGYGTSTNSLRMDCDFVSDGDTAVAGVSFAANNADGTTITIRVYCPAGSSGTGELWSYTQLRIWAKDSDYDYTETAWDAFKIPPGISTQTLTFTLADSGAFEADKLAEFGVQAYWRGFGEYHGPLYIDDAGYGPLYEPVVVHTNNLRYGFEPNKEGWLADTYTGITGIVSVAQSTNYSVEGTDSLRMNVDITNIGTNRAQGAAKVDMRWYPPPVVRAPFDLTDKAAQAYVYCPVGSQSTNPAEANQLRLYFTDGAWNSQYGVASTMRDGDWVKLSMTVTTNGGFQSTNVIAMGVDISMLGTYSGPLYLDAVEFPADALSPPTNSQHEYDFEAAYQASWWKWGANPDEWFAQAWTGVYYATNHGAEASVALAADAVFDTGAGEDYRKGVFEIAYQPALNLSTKDHRRIQAKLRFDPAVEGILDFLVSINVFDKVTDQWYYKEINAGGSGWNILEFDLDEAGEYAALSPPGPMNASAIGFLTIQIYANSSWTGTVYLDDVVVGGRETGTNYNPIAGGFVRADGSKFVVDGTNFYFVGANIEYLQTESDATLEYCLDWAASNGLQVVRTWAMQEGKPYSFQPRRGVWNELMFEHLDRVVAEAGHRNIRLMLAVLDNWAHNGGVFQYVHWVTAEHPESVDTNFNKEGVEYHDQFWTNAYCRQWYKDYVTRLLTRTNSITGVAYRDDPTIFAWEIVNEPRCESDFTGKTIHDWLNEMSDFVRSIDTNHMLGNGEEGGYVNTYDFADTIPWEAYPDNYYHYGNFAVGVSTCDLYGCGRGHGVDFVSDNRSEATYVTWQGGFYTNREPPQGEWRAGNSNINFCTSRLYVDQKEYNLWRTNVNSADQRIEWINDHWYDADQNIGKPMILEEFGIHGIGWIFNGSYGQVQLVRSPAYSEADRVAIYDLYYDHVEKSGMAGSFFWNFGFPGMWDDPFHLCEQEGPWYADTWDGSATTVTLSEAHVREGTHSLRLSWDGAGLGSTNKAIFRCPTNEKWVLRVDNASTNEPPTHGINRTKFFWNFYNPSASNVDVALVLRGTTNWTWCETPRTSLTSGWNRVLFDLSAGTWSWDSNGVWQSDEYLIRIPNSVSNVLEDVHEVALAFYGLTNGPGEAYIDDIQIKRDDGFVIYEDDPVCAVINAHAEFMSTRNVATNDPANHPPVAAPRGITADAFVATNIDLTATDEDGDFLSYRIIQRPTNGWVFGTPPSNMIYKSKPGTQGGDTFTFVAHDGKADSSEAIVTVTLGSTDVDGDDLPDAWEFTFFPKLVQYWPYDGDQLTNLNAAWDWDADGFADYAEWRAGTDPTNLASYLWLGSQAAAGAAAPFIVQWPSAEDRIYVLERSTNLHVGFDSFISNLVANPPMNTYTDAAVSGVGPYLYRVRVE